MGKFKDKEEAKAAKVAAKEELSAAKGELKAFEKEKGLEKGGDHSANEKHGKRWSKLKATVTKKEEALEKITAEISEMKEKKAPRATTYEYPADCVTAADKKKFRAKARAAKKAAEKGEKPKKEKVAKKEETAAPAKEEKSGKEGKKDKKKSKEELD